MIYPLLHNHCTFCLKYVLGFYFTSTLFLSYFYLFVYLFIYLFLYM